MYRLGKRLQRIVDLAESAPLAPRPMLASSMPPTSITASRFSLEASLFPLDTTAMVGSFSLTSLNADGAPDAAPRRPPVTPILSHQRLVTSSRQVSNQLRRFEHQQTRFAKLKVPQAPQLAPNAVVMPKVSLPM